MEVTLTAYPRGKTGSREARKLRRENKVPAVVYGGGGENVNVYVEKREAEKVVSHQERFLTLRIEGGDSFPALVQDVQYDPVSGDVLHLDFMRVQKDEKVEVEVPLELVGAELAPGVQEGGNLEILIHEVTVSCLPGSIPETLTLDASDMTIGDSKTVADIDPVEGVEILLDPGEVVAAVLEPVDVEAETDVEESLKEVEGPEPAVQKQKEPGGEKGEKKEQ